MDKNLLATSKHGAFYDSLYGLPLSPEYTCTVLLFCCCYGPLARVDVGRDKILLCAIARKIVEAAVQVQLQLKPMYLYMGNENMERVRRGNLF